MASALVLIVGTRSSNAAEEHASFVVSPDAGAIAWTVAVLVVVLAALACAGVLIAKRRWGWVVVGLITGGLVWFVAPFVVASPGSPWDRRTERRRGRTAARARHPT